MTYKIGSLFDGSGGFPLAGSLCGITPTWASEVEPYPIAVTRSRFPSMKHLGDISKINGGEVEPVDIITFGSPCQDLSVAGKRAGLKHESNGDEETTRSGLFMEAVRIIKEMREKTNGRYPTFALWENVPGAFSSNKGEDFRVVLEELIKIVEPTCSVPPMPKGGWPYADAYMGDGWSLAYRVFDAQYWGVPQRRRRIHLVLDLRGERAGAVLFEREGVRGYFAEGRTPWQGTTRDAQDCAGADDREGEGIGINGDVAGTLDASYYKGCGMRQGMEREVVIQPVTLEPGIAAREGGHIYEGVSGTLRANAGDNQMAVAYSIENHPADSRVNIDDSGKVQTLTSRMGTGGGNVPMVMEAVSISSKQQSLVTSDNLANTLGANDYKEPQAVVYCLQGNGIDRADTAGCNGKGWTEDVCYTLNTIDRPAVCYAETYQKVTGPLMANSHPGSYTGQDAYTDMLVVGKELKEVGTFQNTCIGWWNESPIGATVRTPCGGDSTMANVCVEAYGVDCRNMNERHELYPTLQAKPNGGQSLNFSHAVRVRYIVRRLTPTECARLQGFADRWGDIDPKEDFTDEEYRFWLDVRNTHATVIGGKEAKEYTKAQMVTWYNRLLTDSAEYKMWGNGIALPPALYCMQGMVDALRGADHEG